MVVSRMGKSIDCDDAGQNETDKDHDNVHVKLLRVMRLMITTTIAVTMTTYQAVQVFVG